MEFLTKLEFMFLNVDWKISKQALEHIRENIGVYDFNIDDNDMITLSKLSSLGVSGYHPNIVDF